MSIDVAMKCFKETLDGVNPAAQPEKYNLYTGLLNMAESLRAIESAVRDIQSRTR